MNYEPLFDLIRKFEGLRLQAYICPAGKWTIGYGSTGPDIQDGLVWTREQAEARMQKDATDSAKVVAEMAPNASENQILAVADFVYNLGIGRLKSSTLLKLIVAGNFSDAANEFDRWVYAGKNKLPGLVARRAAEKELFLK